MNLHTKTVYLHPKNHFVMVTRYVEIPAGISTFVTTVTKCK
jgi:hypothetical protein